MDIVLNENILIKLMMENKFYCVNYTVNIVKNNKLLEKIEKNTIVYLKNGNIYMMKSSNNFI